PGERLHRVVDQARAREDDVAVQRGVKRSANARGPGEVGAVCSCGLPSAGLRALTGSDRLLLVLLDEGVELVGGLRGLEGGAEAVVGQHAADLGQRLDVWAGLIGGGG